MQPHEVVQRFHERLAREKVADWSLWVKKPNFLVAGLIALGKSQPLQTGHRTESIDGDAAVVSFGGMSADGLVARANAARYTARMRRVDGQWRIERFGE